MFLLKKIFSRFLFPIPLCLEVLSIGLLLLWFTRKQKTGKTVVTLAGALLFLFASPFFSDMLLKPLESRYPAACHNVRSTCLRGIERGEVHCCPCEWFFL